ncbi:phospholipid phosphatase 6 [Aplysia californica]|uniref:Phospholipid phosphatase 6 n=1 Tax=Aplysia californica TaxID=6500 RepID=A0ABM0JZ50_APLCA|nr:phospholipid phosphatase 6 [Aplysia californica]
MRKRPIVQKVDDVQISEEETTTQVCTSACLSVWDSFLRLDDQYTKQLALCATRDAPLGYLRPLMKVLEISCHGVPWILGTAVMFLCSHRSQDIEISVNLFFALMFDLIVVGVLKATFRRSRPSHNVMDMFAAPSVDKFSFPSGHSTRAAFMALFLCNHMLSNPLYILVVCMWSLSVSASRILLGRHHILDVVCGFGIGVLSYYTYLNVWLSQDTCLHYLDTYFGHVHL